MGPTVAVNGSWIPTTRSLSLYNQLSNAFFSKTLTLISPNSRISTILSWSCSEQVNLNVFLFILSSFSCLICIHFFFFVANYVYLLYTFLLLSNPWFNCMLCFVLIEKYSIYFDKFLIFWGFWIIFWYVCVWFIVQDSLLIDSVYAFFFL